MESPRRESGQVMGCSHPYRALLFGVFVEKLRVQSVWDGKDIDSSARLSAVLHVGDQADLLSLLYSFLLSFYCFCGA